MVGVAIGDCACRATGEPVQVVIAEGLLIGGERGAAGGIPTVIPARGGAAVARPDEPTHGIVAEGLVVCLRATSNSGYGGRQLQDVAHVVVGAPLAPEGVASLCSAR
jgi:hypothetical protein